MPDRRRPVSRGKRFRVLARDNFRCVYCGATPSETELHIDHLFPVCEGGDDSESNLVTACADCNIGKRGQVITNLTDPSLADRAMRGLREIQRIAKEFRAEANRQICIELRNLERPGAAEAGDMASKSIKEQFRIYQEELP